MIVAFLSSIADASWWLLGFAGWLVRGCAYTVEVECYATHNSFRFPGWRK
jgi:hypothetical protein